LFSYYAAAVMATMDFSVVDLVEAAAITAAVAQFSSFSSSAAAVVAETASSKNQPAQKSKAFTIRKDDPLWEVRKKLRITQLFLCGYFMKK
jgi:hypothetical protein